MPTILLILCRGVHGEEFTFLNRAAVGVTSSERRGSQFSSLTFSTDSAIVDVVL